MKISTMKNLIKSILLVMLCTFTSTNAFAQKDVTTKKVLDKTANQLMSMKAVKANFKISGGGQSTSGTIRLSGSKYKVTTPEMTTWFDGKTQWAYMPDTEEVNVSNPTKAEQASMNPYTFLSLYKKGYNYSMKKNKGSYDIHLVAENKNASIPEVKVNITNSYIPTQVSIRQGKQWMTVSISDLAGNQKFDKSTFTFPKSKYPNAEVIDLR